MNNRETQEQMSSKVSNAESETSDFQSTMSALIDKAEKNYELMQEFYAYQKEFNALMLEKFDSYLSRPFPFDDLDMKSTDQ